MPNPVHPGTATLQWDDKGQPISEQFGDIYFSRMNGLQETQFVFMGHNQLPERWNRLIDNSTFTIAETGFGSGLNFLATWQLWRQQQAAHSNAAVKPRLQFVSVEKFPLERSDLKKALALWPSLSHFAEPLLQHYPPQPATGVHRLLFDEGNVCLTLLFGDAGECLQQLAPCAVNMETATSNLRLGASDFYVDAWYLDGFAPAKNPEMWTPRLFHAMNRLSRANTTFATFTAAGQVKRGLEAAGFQTEKVAGFGRKREMLKGWFDPKAPPPTPEPQRAPLKKRGGAAKLYWHLQKARAPEPGCTAHVAIIGGGLAGCQAAYALSKRNIRVTIFEKHPQLAQEASGNHQGAVYTKLSPHPNPLNELNFAAQVFANHFYSQPLAGSENTLFDACGAACGVLHVAAKPAQEEHYRALAERYGNDKNFCEWLDTERASTRCGVKLKKGGLLLSKSGWLAPARLCEALCDTPQIRIEFRKEVTSLYREDQQWLLTTQDSTRQYTADAVIVANALAALKLSQTNHLPLKSLRGQVTHVSSPHTIFSDLKGLKTVICGDGYTAPAHEGLLCSGATFTLHNTRTELDLQCHTTNLQNLQTMLHIQPFEADTVQHLGGRVGFRTTTPDYFPVVGPAPDRPAMLQRFQRLRHKANASIEHPGAVHPNLYTLLGLGSRGLAYSPLAAELLAALICGEPLPLSQHLYQHLHPARFLIRELMRNQVQDV